MHALIVDDSRAYRMVLVTYLKQLGFEALQAASGFEALSLLQQHPDIQLITVDQQMPKMSGNQFVKLIREKPEFAKTPVLMISVDDRMEQHREALESGVNEYLVKPVTQEMIEDKLLWLGITPPDRGA